MKDNIGHHLWFSKNVDGIDDLLMIVINEMYPELESKINIILKDNNLIKTVIKKDNKFI